MKYLLSLIWIIAAVVLSNNVGEKEPVIKRDLIFWACLTISQIICWS